MASPQPTDQTFIGISYVINFLCLLNHTLNSSHSTTGTLELLYPLFSLSFWLFKPHRYHLLYPPLSRIKKYLSYFSRPFSVAIFIYHCHVYSLLLCFPITVCIWCVGISYRYTNNIEKSCSIVIVSVKFALSSRLQLRDTYTVCFQTYIKKISIWLDSL